MKILLVSDTIGLGIMETRPEPAWRVRFAALRNKDLLAPDYGAMYVAAYAKRSGFDVEVINVVADVHRKADLFKEPNTDPAELSGSPIGGAWAAELSRKHLFDSLAESRPDVILIPVSIYNLALFSRRLLGEIKEACPGSLLVAGGIYSTFHPDELLSDGHADVVVRGEGEITTAELLGALASGRSLDGIAGISHRAGGRLAHNPARPPVADLDSIPNPYTLSAEFNIPKRFDILSETNPTGDYIPGAGFLTSRGCPEACTFCLDPAINGGRTRFHSPGYVRDVLDYCSERFPGGSGAFFFGDATFTMNRKRLGRVLDLLDGLPYTYRIQTRADYLDDGVIGDLAAHGFTDVAIGAETFNERILEEVVRKRLKVDSIIGAAKSVERAGMHPVLTFIAGLPGESRESILRTVEILKSNGLHTATFFPLVVFKGTALFELFKERVSDAEMEGLRLNPMSEEYIFTSEEFPTREELTDFTEEVNRALVASRPPGW